MIHSGEIDGDVMSENLIDQIRELEVDLDGEQRRHQETYKNVRKQDRRVKELQFQVELRWLGM